MSEEPDEPAGRSESDKEGRLQRSTPNKMLRLLICCLVFLSLRTTPVFGDDDDDDARIGGQWSSWRACSKTCGIGTTRRHFICKRRRSCKNGNNMETKTCTIKPCNSSHSRSCPPQFEVVQWPWTQGGDTAVMPCPEGATGNVTRYCAISYNPVNNSTTFVWEEVDTSGCVSNITGNITTKVDEILSCLTMKDHSSSCSNKTKVLLHDLHKQSRNEMKSKEIKTAVYALSVIAGLSKHSHHQDFMDEKTGEIVVNTASNLLEPRNSRSWQQLQEDKSINANTAEKLVKVMDSIGRVIANTSITNTTLIVATNLAMEAKKIDPNTEFPVDGVNFTHNQSSISLPAELFPTSEQSIAVNIIYLTLGDILQLPIDYTDPKKEGKIAVNVNTAIVSSTVTPRKEIKNSVVKIVLKNKRTLPKLNDSSPICISWSTDSIFGAWSDYGCQLVPGESDDDKTTCACSHLTLFATFMDPHQIPLSKDHRFALDFISNIGCAISLFSIATTLTVILPNWRKLKSPRIEVLLNICASIGIVCFLVLVEHPARQNKVLCKMMAVLLHYFLLAAFAWMFCEGVLLYVVLIKVDMTGSTSHSKKPLYLLGWGFPLLIILISLWATELRGYGESPYVCWLSVKNGVTWAFIAPALVVIVANLLVLLKIINRLQVSQKVRNYSLKKQVKTGTRATAATMPLLGVAWLFGMLTFHTNLIVFKYLFTICNSLQGVFIFIFHCLLDRQVRKVFKSSRRRSKRRIQPPIQMKPYEAYVINGPQEVNRYTERRKDCVNNAGIS